MKKLTLSYTAFVVLVAIAFTITAMADSPNEEVIDLDNTSISVITTTTESPIHDSVEARQSILLEDEGVVDTTTTTIYIANDALCPQWWETAKAAGWPEELLLKLDKVIHKESRCNYDSYNPYDPAGGSYGLTQINGYWCTVNKYNPSGWLQAQGILNSCQDLFDPVTNFRAAMALYNYSLNRHGCGWNPWRFC